MAAGHARAPAQNIEIAAAFAQVADLLELQDANPFRVRAYRNAVRTIDNLTRSLASMVESGDDLTELPGIGDDLAAQITELATTGSLTRLRELEGELPRSLVELMHIEGLGPKRARMLYDRLGIRSASELSRAIESERLVGVRGIGPKTIEKLRRGLARIHETPRRFRLIDADLLVMPVLAWLRDCPHVERVEPAGSFRRRRETVGDIDILVVSAKPTATMRHFVAYPDAERVEAAGRTRGTIVLRTGLHVDLRIVQSRSYGAALHYFTGSKAHNIAVRRLGLERGLRISEYGIFRAGHGNGRPTRSTRIGGATEEEVFTAVDLAWIPPELREDRGEIEAARSGALPDLVTQDAIRGDLQMHSTWSDGNDSIEDMVAACVERDYAYMAMTDHSRSATIAHGLGPRDIARQAREIARIRRRFPQIRILHGIEVDILPDGSLDLAPATLARLDLVVVSIHSSMGMDRERMTKRVIRAISQPGVHILAHPTGRLINRREPIEIDLEAVLQAALRAGVAVELNAQPDRLDLDDVHVFRARELGIPIAIDTDAHSAETLSFMRYGIDQARRGWLEPAHVLNTKTPAELATWLRARAAPARSAPPSAHRRVRARRLAPAAP